MPEFIVRFAYGPLARYYGYGQAAGLCGEPLDACPLSRRADRRNAWVRGWHAGDDLTVGRLWRFYEYGLAAGLRGEPPRCLPLPARRPAQRRTQRVVRGWHGTPPSSLEHYARRGSARPNQGRAVTEPMVADCSLRTLPRGRPGRSLCAWRPPTSGAPPRKRGPRALNRGRPRGWFAFCVGLTAQTGKCIESQISLWTEIATLYWLYLQTKTGSGSDGLKHSPLAAKERLRSRYLADEARAEEAR